ncbi:hypothetical protein N9L19_00070 [bacterium]|nr:hypothetical protein [bacterium]
MSQEASDKRAEATSNIGVTQQPQDDECANTEERRIRHAIIERGERSAGHAT